MKYTAFTKALILIVISITASFVVAPFVFSALLSDIERPELEDRCGEIDIRWDPALRANIYELYRNGDLIYSGRSMEYKDRPLIQNNEHEYRLLAINDGGVSEFSEGSVLKVERPCPPEAPEGIDVREMPCGGSVFIEWDPIARADVYELVRKPVPILTGTLIEWSGRPTTLYIGEETSFSDSGLVPGGLYSYMVRGGNETDMGDWYRKFVRASEICPPERPDPPRGE